MHNSFRNLAIGIASIALLAIVTLYFQQTVREQDETETELKQRIYELEKIINQFEIQNITNKEEIANLTSKLSQEDNLKSKTISEEDCNKNFLRLENYFKSFDKIDEIFEKTVEKYKEEVIEVLQNEFKETEENLVNKIASLLNISSNFEISTKLPEISNSTLSTSSFTSNSTSLTNNNEELINKEHFVSILVPIYGQLGGYLRPIFCTYMQSYLEKQIGKNYEIIFAEQADKLPFNRAYALNIASIFTNSISDYFIIHDVDLFPFPSNNYSYFEGVAKMNRFFCNYFNFRSCDQTPKNNFFGGVIKITKKNFELVNGLSNSFWGWGGEDEEFGIRIEQQKSTINIIDQISYHWHVEGLKPESQSREKEMQTEDHKNNFDLILATQKDRNRKFSDGLSQAKFHVVQNFTNFLTVFPVEEFDRSCKLIRFQQSICRKNSTSCS